MRVNLLQGTCTPTLTPMPGVHNALQLTAYSALQLTAYSLRFAAASGSS
jgi:hypothetical protein